MLSVSISLPVSSLLYLSYRDIVRISPHETHKELRKHHCPLRILISAPTMHHFVCSYWHSQHPPFLVLLHLSCKSPPWSVQVFSVPTRLWANTVMHIETTTDVWSPDSAGLYWRLGNIWHLWLWLGTSIPHCIYATFHSSPQAIPRGNKHVYASSSLKKISLNPSFLYLLPFILSSS